MCEVWQSDCFCMYVCLLIYLTRKLCDHKHDSVMHPIYIIIESWLTQVNRSHHCEENEHFIKLSNVNKLAINQTWVPHSVHYADSIQLDVMDVGVERTFSPKISPCSPGSRWMISIIGKYYHHHYYNTNRFSCRTAFAEVFWCQQSTSSLLLLTQPNITIHTDTCTDKCAPREIHADNTALNVHFWLSHKSCEDISTDLCNSRHQSRRSLLAFMTGLWMAVLQTEINHGTKAVKT